MNLITFDNIIKDPISYVSDIHLHGFQDVADGDNVFKNIQPRDANDEFAVYCRELFSGYKVAFNFVRKSPEGQKEPNFIHTDEMMGDLTCILYLNEESPNADGTTIYDNNEKPIFTMYSKFNRMIAFSSEAPHSRNIFENFGQDKDARLVQVVFLKAK
jgi:hypothetical protein